jgi:hypothetical protein
LRINRENVINARARGVSIPNRADSIDRSIAEVAANAAKRFVPERFFTRLKTRRESVATTIDCRMRSPINQLFPQSASMTTRSPT